MQLSLTTSSQSSEAFGDTLFVGVFVVFSLAFGIWLWSWGSAPRVRFRIVAFAASLGFACALWVAYASTLDRFISVDASLSGLRLYYPGPFAREIVLARSDVDTVLWGGGRSNYFCYIKVLSKSGQSYRSVTVDKSLSMCQRFRAQLLAVLVDNTS